MDDAVRNYLKYLIDQLDREQMKKVIFYVSGMLGIRRASKCTVPREEQSA